jgi:hypothetical protein
VRTTTLSLFVLFSAGVFFVVGLLLVNAQRHERGVLLLIVAAALAAGIYFNPSLAALSGQAAVLGLALVTITAILNQILRRDSRLIDDDDGVSPLSANRARINKQLTSPLATTALSAGSSQSKLEVLAKR